MTTAQLLNYAFEVEIANKDGTSNVVLADRLRNVDRGARSIQLIHSVSISELSEVVPRIEAILVNPDV